MYKNISNFLNQPNGNKLKFNRITRVKKTKKTVKSKLIVEKLLTNMLKKSDKVAKLFFCFLSIL